MSKFLQKESNILDMHSEWVGESLIRTVTRHFGKKNKIMVDVMEFSPKATSKKRALHAATNAARRVGCVSVDCCNVGDTEIVRQYRDIHTDKLTRTRIRSMTFAFDGVA
jgi:hypothetical protein